MEFQAKDIAKLVLGYLREEKCTEAFHVFLNTSKHLQDYSERYQKGKPIVTRICGLNLVDYLKEYANIYTIVLERIELTDYFINNPSNRATVIQQLLYLLGNESNESRANSPVANSSAQSINNSHNLQDSSGIRSTVDKSTNTDDEDSFVMQEKCNITHETFTHMFLENKDLHQKLAENINKTVSEFNSSPETNSTRDLDHAIKRIVNHTEQDPIFNQLIDEIIVGSRVEESSSECNDTGSLDVNVPGQLVRLTTPPTCINEMQQEENIRQRLRSSSKKIIIDDQNDMAVNSIITASHVIPPLEENTTFREISNSTVTTTQNNQIYTSTGLLMIQPQPANIISTVTKEAPKPYCVIGSQPFMSVPQLNTVFSEQDILTMPTIIVCDTNQVANTQTVVSMKPPSDTLKSSHGGLLKIAPKIEKPKTLSEYITMYNCEEPSPVKDVKPQKKQPTKKKTTATKKKISESSESTSESIPQLQTPQLKTESKDARGRSTPHSGGSHVRQLNFSTPEKINIPKSLQDTCSFKNKTLDVIKEPNVKQPKPDNAFPVSVDKAPVKSIVPEKTENLSILATDKQVVGPTTSTKKAKAIDAPSTSKSFTTSSGCWDADLRALASTINDEVAKPKPPSKSKRKRTVQESPSDTPSTSKKAKESDTLNITEQNAAKIEAMLVSPVKDLTATQEPTCTELTTIESTESKFVILNRNKKPKYKKKCNIDSHEKKNLPVVPVTEQVVLTSITKVASCEIIDDTNKVVLSPSKMNVSKRNIISLEQTKEEQEQNSIIKPTSPEAQNIIATTNFTGMPLLETPVKIDPADMSKPPTVFYTPAVGTPFTKAVIDQLCDVDLNTIQTPKFPITPHFILTPLVGKEPLVQRGTDYSTSSSYYQPSEPEYSKSLEQLLEEDKQFDTEPQKVAPQLPNTLSLFNHNLVGKKDLKLVKKTTEKSDLSDSSSSSTSESSPSSDSDSSDYTPQEKLNTSNKSVKQRYSFRPRRNTTFIEEPLTKIIKTHQELLLQEMEEKRQRTIARFKNGPDKNQSKETPKSKKKPPARRKSTATVVPKKTPAPKKRTKSFTQGNAIVTSNKEVVLHLVSDDEMQVEPFEVVEANLLENSSSSTPISEFLSENKECQKDNKENEDQAADSLVKGLKEWGIHLIPKKKTGALVLSPTKTTDDIVQDSDLKTNAIETATTIETHSMPSTTTPEKTEALKILVSEKIVKIIHDHTFRPPEKSQTHLPDNKENPELNTTKVQPTSKEETASLVPEQVESTLTTKSNNEKEIQSKLQNMKPLSPPPSTVILNALLMSEPDSKQEGVVQVDNVIADLDLSLEDGEVISDEEVIKPKKPERRKSTISKSHSRHDSVRKRRHSSDHSESKSSRKRTKQAQPKPKEMFSVKSISRETVRLKHDYHKKCSRTLSDYNIEILSKTISASVYLTEHDMEVTRVLAFTPTEYILDIPSKDKPESEKNKHNEHTEDPSTSRLSALDGLYPEKSSKYKCDSTDIQYKIAERKYSDKSKESKSRKHHSDSKDSKRHTSPRQSKTIENEGNDVIIDKNEDEKLKERLSDATKLLAELEAQPGESPSTINDDLMNYAIIGSTRAPDTDEFQLSLNDSVSKPICNDEDSIKEDNRTLQSEDTAACQELLRNIDVDSFLKKLHGDM